MSAQHQLELVYRDLRSLRQKVLDLDPMLPTDVTSRRLPHGLDDFEEELRILILQTFKPPLRYGSTAPQCGLL
jgi:hypothetical protein